jgi:hypothetical protein
MMNRRNVLSLISGVSTAFLAGCVATAPGTERAATTTSTTTNTPFPDEYGGPVQGGADEPLTVSIQEPEGYSDGSIACIKRAAGAMRSHLENECARCRFTSTWWLVTPIESRVPTFDTIRRESAT